MNLPSNRSELRSHARALACATLACAALARADDTPVYRCGNSYSAQRCGQAAPLELGDARSDAQRAQAADVARRERRLAEALTAERLKRETLPTPPRPPRARPPCAASAAERCRKPAPTRPSRDRSPKPPVYVVLAPPKPPAR